MLDSIVSIKHHTGLRASPNYYIDWVWSFRRTAPNYLIFDSNFSIWMVYKHITSNPMRYSGHCCSAHWLTTLQPTAAVHPAMHYFSFTSLYNRDSTCWDLLFLGGVPDTHCSNSCTPPGNSCRASAHWLHHHAGCWSFHLLPCSSGMEIGRNRFHPGSIPIRCSSPLCCLQQHSEAYPLPCTVDPGSCTMATNHISVPLYWYYHFDDRRACIVSWWALSQLVWGRLDLLAWHPR